MVLGEHVLPHVDELPLKAGAHEALESLAGFLPNPDGHALHVITDGLGQACRLGPELCRDIKYAFWVFL